MRIIELGTLLPLSLDSRGPRHTQGTLPTTAVRCHRLSSHHQSSVLNRGVECAEHCVDPAVWRADIVSHPLSPTKYISCMIVLTSATSKTLLLFSRCQSLHPHSTAHAQRPWPLGELEYLAKSKLRLAQVLEAKRASSVRLAAIST